MRGLIYPRNTENCRTCSHLTRISLYPNPPMAGLDPRRRLTGKGQHWL